MHSYHYLLKYWDPREAVEVRWGRLHNGSFIQLHTILELRCVSIQTIRFQGGLVCRTCFVCSATAIATARDRRMCNKTRIVPANTTLTPPSCNHSCCGKTKRLTYSECAFLALCIQHSMLRIILSSVASPILPYFPTLYQKRQAFRKNFIKHKMCVLIFPTTFV